MGLRRALVPVDRWVSFCNLFVAITWLPLAQASPLAREFLAGHLLLAALPWLLTRRRNHPLRLPPVVCDLYPLLMIAALWSELGIRHRFTVSGLNDQLISRTELTLFGLHPHEVGVRLLHAPWLLEVMHGVYFTYYVLLIGVPVLVLLANSRIGTQRMVLRLAVGYLGCFLIYFIFPVEGPRSAFPASIAPLANGGFAMANSAIRSAGDSLGTAFPSSHVVGTISLAWAAWEAGPVWLRVPSVLAAAAIPAATVYTQNHYALDALFGVVVALLLHRLVVPAVAASTRVPAEG
jgi:hypothetical protein